MHINISHREIRKNHYSCEKKVIAYFVSWFGGSTFLMLALLTATQIPDPSWHINNILY